VLLAFFDAQHINHHSGGAVIAPWDLLEGLTLFDWAEAAMMLSDVPKIRKRNEVQRKVFEKVRRQNKHYAQIHYRKAKVH
jgi:hypothetical protein